MLPEHQILEAIIASPLGKILSRKLKMRPACVVVAALLCTMLARGQSQNSTSETQAQILYKAFAQNLEAFNVFLDLLPVRPAARCQSEPIILSSLVRNVEFLIVMLQAPTEATVKRLYSTWLSNNKGVIL